MNPVPKPVMNKKKKRKKLPSMPSLIRKADQVFSKFIRERDGHKCCTCGKPAKHAGHYIRRAHKRARWNTYNVNAQCVYCNTYLDGNMDAYALFLVNKHGIYILNELQSLKGTYKPSREELNQIITAYS